MSAEPGSRAARRRTAGLIVVLQLFFAVATVPIWAVLGLAKMDGGSSLTNALLDVAVFGYPVAVLLAVVMSWRAWRAGRLTAAVWWHLPPMAWVLGIAVSALL